MIKKIISKIVLTTLILSILVFSASSTYAAEDLKWNMNLDEMTLSLGDICYGNGIFVVVGDNGTIKTSDDGIQWTSRNTGVRNILFDVSWGSDQFIAVGSSGIIMTSKDGAAWTVQKSGTTKWLSCAIWNGKQYIVIGEDGTFLSSSNGINWSKAQTDTSANLSSIVYNDGQYVAIADNNILLSLDGMHWTSEKLPMEYDLYNIVCNNHVFIISGSNGTTYDKRSACILVSKDGVSWTTSEYPSDGLLGGIACSGNTIVAVGGDVSAISNDNGETWVFSADNMSPLSDAVFAENKYVGIGMRGTIEVSSDGIRWTDIGLTDQCDFEEVIWANNMFVAVGGNGNSTVYTSYNADDWTKNDVKSWLQSDVIWDGTKFISVGTGGYVLTSKDGLNWETSFTPASYLKNIAWNGKIYTAVGFRGIVYTSPDCSNWTFQTAGLAGENLNGIAWNGKYYIAAGGALGEGIILKSTDGISWTKVHYDGTEPSNEFYGVVWTNNQFLAYGSCGTLFISKDGSNWTAVQSKAAVGIHDVVWTGSKYYYVGDFGLMGSSKDGVSWQLENSGTSVTLKSITWNGQKLVAAGYFNAILSAIPTDIIKVTVDGKPIIFDVAPITNDSRTLVPLRAIFEALGAEIEWNGQTSTVHATKNSFNMILKVGSNTASVNGSTTIMEVPAVNYNGRVLVPTRFIAESLGADVDWDAATRTVLVKTQ